LHQPSDPERESAADEVCDDAGRDLADEDRSLHHGPDQDELERVELRDSHEVHGYDNPCRQREEEPQREIQTLSPSA
jgi:hypothetical protein